jgi:hypothetical protein
MCPPDGKSLTEADKQRKLSELQRRLTGQRLPEDFTNGAQETVLLRDLAARGYDVDKALAVRVSVWARVRAGTFSAFSALRSRWRVRWLWHTHSWVANTGGYTAHLWRWCGDHGAVRKQATG